MSADRLLVRSLAAFCLLATATFSCLGAQAIDEEFAAARKAAIAEGKTARLDDVAELTVPPGWIFVPRKESARLLSLRGRGPSLEHIGVLLPARDVKAHFIDVEFIPVGHVQEPTAKWDADKILAAWKRSEEGDNPSRMKNAGFAHHTVGWIIPPAYDASRHGIVVAHEWISDSGQQKTNEAFARVILLGRDGVLKFGIGWDRDEVRAAKDAMLRIFREVRFLPGKRYEDYRASLDRNGPSFWELWGSPEP